MEKELLVNIRLECMRQACNLLPTSFGVSVRDADSHTPDEKARQLVMVAKILYNWIVE